MNPEHTVDISDRNILKSHEWFKKNNTDELPHCFEAKFFICDRIKGSIGIYGKL